MKQVQRPSLITFFLVFSILLHLLFFTSLRWTPSEWLRPSDLAAVPVEFDLISEETISNNSEAPKQLVDQEDKNSDELENKTAKYLSARNQKILHETVAENRGAFKNVRSQGAEGTENSKEKKNPSAKFQETPSAIQKQAASDLADLEKDPETKLAQDKNILFKKLTQKYNSRRMFDNVEKNSAPPSPASTGQASQTSDYLKGKDPGLETLLNTREYRYYTYFNRIRRRLSEHWEPKVKAKVNRMLQQGRTIASTDDKVTKLLIVLNDNGVLVKVQVLSDSGIRDLDDAAIEAFRAAAPFPHPPDGIVDEEGTIKIRWDFVLES